MMTKPMVVRMGIMADAFLIDVDVAALLHNFSTSDGRQWPESEGALGYSIMAFSSLRVDGSLGNPTIPTSLKGKVESSGH